MEIIAYFCTIKPKFLQNMDIKSVIQNHGFQIQDIAKKMEVKQSTLSGMLSGNPTIGTLRKIAEAAGCSVAEFFLDEISREQVAEMFGLVVPQEKDVEELSYQDGQQQEGQQQMRMHLRGIGDIDAAMPPAPPEKPAASEQPQGTALVGLVRCPQCGHSIRLFAEE